MEWKDVVDKTKNHIAKINGFKEGVLGSSWNYAMNITHRKKSQIELYDAVIAALGIYVEELSKIKEGVKQ